MKTQSFLVLVMVCVLLALNSGTQAVTIDWVTVGNAGNAGEQSRLADYGDTTYYGSVSDVYQIGRYEVTAGQYRDFLNAVAATDTYGLYNASMDVSIWGCQITRNGSSGSYTYDFSGRPSGDESDWANRPVNYVNWYDTLRFANWLHNGQPTGAQDDTTTERGAYNMLLGDSVVRELGALVWLTSEDEWYKAAYHKNDGVTGNYFDYPTSSDSTPSNDLIDPDPGNNATFYTNSHTIGTPYWRTEVGAHENSDSPYGTFDMGGNVWEWNEALIPASLPIRGIRGGSFTDGGGALRSSLRISATPSFEFNSMGFRVASVPEPATIMLLGLGGLGLLRRRKSA